MMVVIGGYATFIKAVVFSGGGVYVEDHKKI
jgi:hypothetical protein